MVVRAHPTARGLLAVGGVVVALASARWPAAAAALVLGGSYLALGQARLGRGLLRVLIPLVLFTALLRVFVAASSIAGLPTALIGLLGPDAPLVLLLRVLVGSCAMALACATIPDGEAVATLRKLRVPQALTLMLVSGGVLARAIAESQARSLTALRAQGVVSSSPMGRIFGLPTTVALTWTATLALVLARAEVSWAGNNILDRLDHPVQAVAVETWPTLVMAVAGAAMIFLAALHGPPWV